MTKPPGTAGCLVAVAVGALLTLVMRSSLPGLVVMLAGAVASAVVLVRSVGSPGRREWPRRAQVAAQHDPDRAYFDTVREVAPRATTRNPAAVRSRVEDRESQGAYVPGIHPRPEAGPR